MTTLEIALIITVFILFVLAAAAANFAAFLFGATGVRGKMIVSAARREKRLNRQMLLWQDKALIRAGAGILRPVEQKTPSGDDDKKVIPRFTSPTEAIERTRAERARVVPKVTTTTVPPSVKSKFLAETKQVNAGE